MSVGCDVHEASDADTVADGGMAPEQNSRSRRRGWIVLLIGVWNLWVWGTRLRNVLTDDQANTTAFDLIHSALFTVSSVLAAVLCVVGYRMIREHRS